MVLSRSVALMLLFVPEYLLVRYPLLRRAPEPRGGLPCCSFLLIIFKYKIKKIWVTPIDRIVQVISNLLVLKKRYNRCSFCELLVDFHEKNYVICPNVWRENGKFKI